MSWFKKVWALTDAALLLSLFALLGVAVWREFSPSDSIATGEKKTAAEERSRMEIRKPAPSKPQKRPMVIRGIRVNNRMLPMDRVAEHMVSEPLQERTFHALDMRERDRSYEISLSLPDGVDEEGVSVSAKGHILSLALSLPNGEFRSRRIRIPARIMHPSQVSHHLTNGVLRIQVKHQ